MNAPSNESQFLLSRRKFLERNAMGLGSVALAWLLAQDRALARGKFQKAKRFDLVPKTPIAPARAKAMISLFQHGGPSHIDLFDPKPTLSRLHGKEYSGNVHFSFVNRASKRLFGSPWKFSRHGDCGTPVSELLPHTAKIVDKIAVLRSMHTGANGHEVSIRYFHGGIPGVLGRPHFASWLTYGLGAETDSLPAYMVLRDPGGHPVDGVNNWSNGFLPSLYQGTVLRPKEPRIANLDAPPHLRGPVQRRNLDFLRELNERHAKAFPAEADLEARIASYELAAAMQTSAREALDISGESEATKKLYGIDRAVTRDYGTRCLIARRLVERGVRFVQLFHSNQPWDNHSTIQSTLPSICAKTDQPSAALVLDLEQRGLLDSTIVHWGGEIGRLPVTENHGGDTKKMGRDHNGQGFTIWLAGGGIRGGMAYGETDDVGHRAVVDRVTPNDYQATLLHLFGLNHRELVFEHGGQKHIITAGRESRVVHDILL
ncbi:MAG: DUF1501 domain-containing protein [Planctomycetota bacterium]